MAAEIPVWIKPYALGEIETELGDALQMGGTGLWLDQQLFTVENITSTLEIIGKQVHPLEISG